MKTAATAAIIPKLTPAEMREESWSLHDMHLALRSSEEKCTRCGQRREQVPNLEITNFTYAKKNTYLDEDGEKRRKVSSAWHPLQDGGRQLCSSCRSWREKPLREATIAKKHSLACITEKLAAHQPSQLSAALSTNPAKSNQKGGMS